MEPSSGLPQLGIVLAPRAVIGEPLPHRRRWRQPHEPFFGIEPQQTRTVELFESLGPLSEMLFGFGDWPLR